LHSKLSKVLYIMVDSLLNKISRFPNNTIVTGAWLTGQTGEIVDIKGDCVFRFVDYIDDGELRLRHTTDESRLSCPIVATGLVGYWLHHKDEYGVKDLFESYFDLRMQEYERAYECDDDAWDRDLKKEFVCRYHIPTEKKWINASEALFAYITENDQKKVKSITSNYLKFARAKRKELFPPKYTPGKEIEEAFISVYEKGGAAWECVDWMRTEYNMPSMGPHWEFGGKEKDQLSGRWKVWHEQELPEWIAEQFEDFDDGVLMYSNGGLMDEINENLKQCHSHDDRVRYIVSLIQPFKEFASAFHPKARIDERKRAIIRDRKSIEHYRAIPNDAVDERTGRPIRPKAQIAAIEKTIDKFEKDIIYWEQVCDDFYWLAQHGLGGGHYREFRCEVNEEICKYLGIWWELMINFSRRLAALALTYGIKLMDVQEQCEVYLNWEIRIWDYVDNKFISSTEHAKRLLEEIEPHENLTELEYKILNLLCLHGKEIDPSIKNSKQVYDFEELGLYTKAEITECSKSMQAKGWIYCFIDHEGCPAYWHELKDNGRIVLREHLTQHPGMAQKPQQTNATSTQPAETIFVSREELTEKPAQRRGRPPRKSRPDIHYTLIYKPTEEETDDNNRPIPLSEKARQLRILQLYNALTSKYKWIDKSTPDYAFVNLLSGIDISCNITWNEGVSNNAKTAFIKSLVDDGVCSLTEGCSGINEVVTSQFGITPAYRAPKAQDKLIIHELELILKPELDDRRKIWSYAEEADDSQTAQHEVDRKNIGIQNRPGSKIL